jgi:hypothetical protein
VNGTGTKGTDSFAEAVKISPPSKTAAARVPMNSIDGGVDLPCDARVCVVEGGAVISIPLKREAHIRGSAAGPGHVPGNAIAGSRKTSFAQVSSFGGTRTLAPTGWRLGDGPNGFSQLSQDAAAKKHS